VKMENLFNLIVFLHIFAGFMGLITFPVPLTAAEGSELQERAKNIFFWAAISIIASAAMLVTLRIGEIVIR